MRSTLDEIAKEISEIRDLVASILPVNLALSGHHDSAVRQYLTIRRRFDYAAFIVALYASFEKFAENLVASYARLFTLRHKYEDLPESLTRKHMRISADVLSRGRLGEGRHVGLREFDVVKNLFDCLSGVNPYSLNEVAVVAHELNLRSEELGKLFTSIGIKRICERSHRVDALVGWFCSSKGLDKAPVSGIPAATVQKQLDDLVDRRNQVTHRGGNPLNLLGTSEMTDLVDFVEALANSVYVLSVASYLEWRFGASNEAEKLQLVKGPLKMGTVVIAVKPTKRLYVGQPIYTLSDSIGVRWGRIRDLQLDDVSTTAVEQTSTATEIGVKLDFEFPKGSTIFILDVDDDVVWGPDETRETVAAADAAVEVVS